MSARIQLLDPVMINQIAAGEVVERPLSVVKELTENAIDAGASVITVEIKDGGVSYIRVTDNGRGIPKDEVRTAFMQHATSKVSSPDDLTRISTLGFRGEALSSIAAVSQAEMVTKTASDITGLRIQISGGEVISEKETGCADGASVIVRNLFSNTPARLKFLKKPGAEAALISDFMNRLALCRPDIAFKYINNGAIALSANGGGDLKAAILYVYGSEYTNKLIEIDDRGGDFSLSGFIAKPEQGRPNRSHQNFFTNGRYVRCKLAREAIEAGYEGKLTAGRFPMYVLNLRIRPEMVDVNVHPNKLDVRFRDEEAVYAAIRGAVTRSLAGPVIIPKASAAPKPEKRRAPLAPEQMPLPVVSPVKYKLNEQPPEVFNTPEEPPPQPSKAFLPQYRIIGQFFQTYWIVESGESVFIIDQHAAHERVLYEDIRKRLQAGKPVSQRLAVPVALNLTPDERLILDENRDMIESCGFELEDIGGADQALRAVPVLFKEPENAGFVIEILENLKSLGHTGPDPYGLRLDAAAQAACKAAVKASDRLSFAEARALIEQMLALPEPFTCPHGRPTVVEMTKYEWDKRFKRT